jgi:hypothetical protein
MKKELNMTAIKLENNTQKINKLQALVEGCGVMTERRLFIYSVCADEKFFAGNYPKECVLIVFGNVGNATDTLLYILKGYQPQIMESEEFESWKQNLIDEFVFEEKAVY